MDAATVALACAVIALAVVVGMLMATVRHQRRRMDELAAQIRSASPVSTQAPDPAPVVAPPPAEFVITSVGQATAEPAEPVSNQLVLSATLGEPLVKAAAFAHGLRRALSPESRNRILFQVRQEVRRTRKERRREMRQAWREMKQQRDAA